ncbi:MAG: transporter ATP-binding protein [Anaerocolumna sp.]|jgi:ABC-2 type transport system ATP-binding protein|nr:transporter ATP-binding protein [Anaerocolumna sp.]
MSFAIQVDGLKKSYNSHAVLQGLKFNVIKGEIFALLGVNGTGKTTTLECIEGLRKFDSGDIVVNGKMGIQLQSASLPDHIKVVEAVQLFAKWNRVEIDHSMLAALGVNELAKKQYVELSMGQKRRLHLALSLVHNPDIVFLDEPTAGLDVEGRISLHGEIRKLKEQGKTIVMASHDMAEVESLCDRIAILKDGDIAFIGTVEELTAKIGRYCTIYIKTNQGIESFESDNISDTIITRLEEYKNKGITVLDIRIDRGTLEQHFINISKGDGK